MCRNTNLEVLLGGEVDAIDNMEMLVEMKKMEIGIMELMMLFAMSPKGLRWSLSPRQHHVNMINLSWGIQPLVELMVMVLGMRSAILHKKIVT